MADYKDPDEFFDKSQIEFGNGGGQQSIRESLKATNGAAYRNEWALQALTESLKDFVRKVWNGTSWEFENQGKDGHLTDTPMQSLKATNGQVYRNAVKLAAIADELAALRADVAAIRAAIAAPAVEVVK